MGSHTIRVEGLGDRVAHEVRRFNDNRWLPAPVDAIRGEVDRLAKRDMRRVMYPKSFSFQVPGRSSGQALGSRSTWIVEVSLRPNGRYQPINAPDPDSIAERKQRNRINESSGAASSRQASGVTGGRKGASIGVYVSPFMISPVDIGSLGARLTGKVSAGYRSRQVSFSATNSHGIQSSEELKGPLHTYRSEMQLDIALTPPGRQHRFPLGGQRIGVDVHVPGGLRRNRADAPQTITFTDPNAPGSDVRNAPGPEFRVATQTHPIQVSEPSYNPPPLPDGTPAPGPRQKLIAWANDHLGLSPRPARDRFRTASTRRNIADRAAADNADTLATDVFRDNLAKTTTGPLTLYLTDPYGRPRTMYVWSFPTRFEIQPDPPDPYDLRSVTGSTKGVTSGKSQTSFFRVLLGGGLDIAISVLDFIVGRIAPLAVNFTGQIQRQHGDSRNQSGSLSSLFWGSPDTAVYKVTRNYYVQFDGEPEVHSLRGTTYETTTVDNARRLVGTEAPAPAASPSDTRQPPSFRRGFSYTWAEGQYFQRPPGSDRAVTANEGLVRQILHDLSHRYPGLVLPDFSRNEKDFAIRPGNEDRHWWQRSVRENRPMRRSYETAVENTQRIVDALSEPGLVGNDGDLYGRDGILIPLLESATFKHNVKAVRVFGELGAAEYTGEGDRGVGAEAKSSSNLGAGKGRGGSLAITPMATGNFMTGRPDAQGRREGGFLPKLRATLAFSRNGTRGQVATESTATTLQFKGQTDLWRSPSTITVRTYIDDDLGQDFGDRPLRERGSQLGVPRTLRYEFATPRLPAGTTIGLPGNEDPPVIEAMTREEAADQIRSTGRPGNRPMRDPALIDRLRNAGASITDVNTTFREAGRPQDRNPTAERDQHRDADAHGDQRGNGERPRDRRPNRSGPADAGRDVGLTEATYRQFSRSGVGGRYRWGRNGNGRVNGYAHKIRHMVRDSAAGRHFFANYSSPSNMAAHLQDGVRASTDVSSRLRSPHNLRTTTDTRPEVSGIEAEPVSAEFIRDDTNAPQDRVIRDERSTSAGIGGAALSRINVANEPAAPPADPGQGTGTTTLGSSQAPTWWSGPQAHRTWIFNSKSDSTATSRSSATTMLPSSHRAYLFRAAGTIKQATEFARNWSIGPTVNRSAVYAGWQATSNILYSGFMHAWGAITHGLVGDGLRVDRDDDGAVTGLSRVPLEPPALEDRTDVRVRPGFEGHGAVQTPPDAGPALARLNEGMRARHLELTRNSRDKLYQALVSDLADHASTRGHIPVKVRRTDVGGMRPHGLTPAIDAVVDVGVTRFATRLESVGGEAEIRRRHQVKTGAGSTTGFATRNTAGVQGHSLMVPTQDPPADNTSGTMPDGARPTPYSTVHDNRISSTEGSGREITDIGANAAQLAIVSPYAQISQDTRVSLDLSFPDRGLAAWAQVDGHTRHSGISAQDSAGRTYVTYPTHYLELDRGDGPGDERTPPELHPARIIPADGETPDRQWQDWAPHRTRSPASRGFIEVIENGGKAVRNLSHVGLAAANGWRPGDGHMAGGTYTDAGVESARAFLDDKFGRDAYYDGVDDSLTEVALASSWKEAAGNVDGYRPPSLGRTSLALKAGIARGGSRVLDIAYTGSIYGASGAEHGNSAPGTHVSTLENSGGPSVAAEIHADHNGYQRQVTDYNSLEAGAVFNSGGTDAPTFTAKGSSTSKSNVADPLYLVEFDVDWGVFAQRHDRSGTPAGDAFMGTTRTRQTGWVTQQDALETGLVSPELVRSTGQAREELLRSQDDFGTVDDALLEARQSLLPAAVDAVREGPDSAAHDRYRELHNHYDHMVDAYGRSLRAWRDATNAIRDLLAPPERPTVAQRPEDGHDGRNGPGPPAAPAPLRSPPSPTENAPTRTMHPRPPEHPRADPAPTAARIPPPARPPRLRRANPSALPPIPETPEDTHNTQNAPEPPTAPAPPPTPRPRTENTPSQTTGPQAAEHREDDQVQQPRIQGGTAPTAPGTQTTRPPSPSTSATAPPGQATAAPGNGTQGGRGGQGGQAPDPHPDLNARFAAAINPGGRANEADAEVRVVADDRDHDPL